MSGEAIGMMDKAYFVGKVAILQWLNELLEVNFIVISLVTTEQNRTMCYWLSVLRCYGRLVPKYFQLPKSQVECQT
jgi:hypothetical protein